MDRAHLIALFVQIALLILINNKVSEQHPMHGEMPCVDGECKSIIDCPDQLVLVPHNVKDIKFCNKETSQVCCPLPQKPVTYATEAATRIAARMCLTYRNLTANSCKPEGYIIGGKKANSMEFPHMALIGFKRSPTEIDWYCGGTLISERFVASAAHCFNDDDRRKENCATTTDCMNVVRLGELDYKSSTDDAQPQDFSIISYLHHPSYDGDGDYNDIVLLELSRPVIFSDYIKPACLSLTTGEEFSQFIAAGWGTTRFLHNDASSHLLKVTLNRFDTSACNTEDFQINENTQLCAGSKTGEFDTCTGDSGGPLFVDHPQYACMHLLVGITSAGNNCGRPDSPGWYTRVHLYMDWIERVVWNASASISA